MLLIGVLLGMLGSMVPASAQSPPQLVQDAIETTRKECLPDRFEMLKGFMTQRDINGDKIADYVLDYGQARCGDAETFYCGTGGCLTQVFASRDDGSHVKVLDENVRQLRFARVKARDAARLARFGLRPGGCGALRRDSVLER
jgi:hypothetical protein